MNQTKILNKKVIDPICGMTVDPRQTELASHYKGCKYYFCAEACRSAFERSPEKYLNPKPPKRLGLWGRYLQRLEKATAGKSMNCH